MKASPVIYAVYQDMGGSWRIQVGRFMCIIGFLESKKLSQAVPVTPNSFDSRKKLPAEWCGLRDGVLSEKVLFIEIMPCNVV